MNQVSASVCGNGVLDPGEQCDYAIPAPNSECCTKNCSFRGPSFPCGLNGACSDDGICFSRGMQCNNYNFTVFKLPDSSLVGSPWVPCGSASFPSPISEIVSPDLKTQSSCSLSCNGKVLREGNSIESTQCIDFANYTASSNLISPKVFDYLQCFIPEFNDANDNIEELTKSDKLEKILNPGICMSGKCRVDVCREYRCSGKGSCILGKKVYNLFVAYTKDFSITRNVSNVFESEDSLISCRCDEGRHGVACEEVGSVNITNIENGKASTAYTAGLVLSVLLILLGVGLVTLLVVRVHKKKKGNKRLSHKSLGLKCDPLPECEFEIQKLKKESDINFVVEAPPSLHSRQLSSVSNNLNNNNNFTNNNPIPEEVPSTPPNYLVAKHIYTPRLIDEINLIKGDIIYLIHNFDDGWAKGYNLRTGKEGIFPLVFTSKLDNVEEIQTENMSLPDSTRDKN
jgi:hypothetical protein